MLAVLIQVDGWDPIANAAVTLRLCSHDHPSVCHLDGQTWWPALVKAPTLAYDLFDGAFGGQIAAPASSLTMTAGPWPHLPRYTLADARIRLWTGTPGAAWADYTLRFDGRVTGQPQIRDGRAEVAFAVDDRWLDRPLLATYAGTTGAEGTAALKGQPKPIAIGAPRYVAGVLTDPVLSIFQVSGYGAVQGIDVALDRLVRFGAPIADYPDHAALAGAAIPAGGWATCNAAGFARFGAPPSGQVCFLLRGDRAGPDGWVRRPGQVIRRLALLSGGLGRIDDASLDAIDAARPYNQSLYLEQQTTARMVIQQLAASINAVAGVSWLGKLFVLPVAFAAPTVTLAADGAALPPVTGVDLLENAAPWKALALKAERTWSVHGLGDIAFTAPLIELAYTAGTTYREGNIVELSDGSRWIYVATAPSNGNVPTLGSAFWSRLAAATDAASVGGTAAAQLLGDVAAAKAGAANAIADLADLANDGVLTPAEKIQKLIPRNAELEALWSLLDTQAAVAGNAAANARSMAANARQGWLTYRDTLSPVWSNTSLDTAVVRSTYNGKLSDYRYAIDYLAEILRQYAATTSTWSGTRNDNGGKPADGATATTEPAYNSNPDFRTWPDPAGMPAGFIAQVNMGPGVISRVAGGQNGGWALRVAAPGGSTQQMQQIFAPGLIGDQLATLEVDLDLESGTLVGGGVLVRGYTKGGEATGDFFLTFATDRTIAGTAPGAGVPGTLYRWRKTIKFPPGTAQVYFFGATANDFSYGSMAAARTYVWRRFALTPTSDMDLRTYDQADGATRNRVVYSTTAPAAPVDGDIWVDLNGAYAVFKLRSAGAWQVGATALAAYNQLSGRPIALADINTTESSKLAGIAAGADVTRDSPIVTHFDNAGRTRSALALGANLLFGVKSTVSAFASAADQGNGTGATITVPDHVRTVAGRDGLVQLTYNGGSLTNRPYATVLHVFVEDPNTLGGAVTYQSTENILDAQRNSRIHVTTITTPAQGAASSGGSGGAGSSAPPSYTKPGYNIP